MLNGKKYIILKVEVVMSPPKLESKKITKVIKHIVCVFAKKKNLNIFRDFSCCEYAFSIIVLLIFTHTPNIEKAGCLATACHSNLILKNASSVPSCNKFIV